MQIYNGYSLLYAECCWESCVSLICVIIPKEAWLRLYDCSLLLGGLGMGARKGSEDMGFKISLVLFTMCTKFSVFQKKYQGISPDQLVYQKMTLHCTSRHVAHYST